MAHEIIPSLLEISISHVFFDDLETKLTAASLVLLNFGIGGADGARGMLLDSLLSPDGIVPGNEFAESIR